MYGYATGEYSSRRIEAATHDSMAFRHTAANAHPDHDSLSTKERKTFLGLYDPAQYSSMPSQLSLNIGSSDISWIYYPHGVCQDGMEGDEHAAKDSA